MLQGVKIWGWGGWAGGVNLVISVDPQLERHSPSKLVSFASNGNVVGVDLALNVHVFVESNIEELDSYQRLRVVHLHKQSTKASLNTYLRNCIILNKHTLINNNYCYYVI